MTWLVFDGEVSWSRARFSALGPVGQYVSEAVGTVVSAGATIDAYHRTFGSLRWRYVGPRALIEDNTVRSQATGVVNLQGGYRLAKNAKLALDVFNLFNAADSDIDYFYTSRLPGEPLDGVADIHTHPLPRTARLNLVLDSERFGPKRPSELALESVLVVFLAFLAYAAAPVNSKFRWLRAPATNFSIVG